MTTRADEPRSALCHSEPDRIEVRGRDLVNDLMGRLSFTGYFYFLVTGKEPDERQRFFLDLLLVTIAEHGLTPSAIAARMTYAAAPDALQGAVAAGILGAGGVILGAAGRCADVLVETARLVDGGSAPDAAASTIAAGVRQRGERMPGFGHPIHHPVDPRAERILALSDEKGAAGRHIDLARRFVPAVRAAWGRDLPMNVSMPMAACLLDLGFPASMVKAIPILARTAGLLAHIAEEERRPIGFRLADAAEKSAGYDGGSGG